ncbi:MAG: hypothetical protein LBF57_00970 [Holosporaceae bacterium]|jgi:hypothetical protein|nr:hypothetical protein [Holosporaceae bacterium]
MLKGICCFFVYSILFCKAFAEHQTEQTTVDVQTFETEENMPAIDASVGIKALHERKDRYAFGGKNSSVVALTPALSMGENFILEGDVSYGYHFKYTGALLSEKFLPSYLVGDRATLHEVFDRSTMRVDSDKNINKPHFYRGYTRAIYNNKGNNFRAILGDAAMGNTIGFQSSFSGGGISIFRQDGNGNSINNGSPIVITRLSKFECRMRDQVVAVRILRPGVYSFDDLPEEAKLPDVKVKISDYLGRSEELVVDYWGGYGTLEEGKDDFIISVLCNHRWDVDDPYRLRYKKKPYYSGNYRYGFSDEITVGVGGQSDENSYLIDTVVIFTGEFGKISPNFAYSDVKNEKRHRTVGLGIFYALPDNEIGIHSEIFLAFKGRNFGGPIGADAEQNRRDFIDKFFSKLPVETKQKLYGIEEASASKQLVFRVFSKQIWGTVPSFVFKGEWAKNHRLREYTLCFTTKISGYTLALSGGLTYDDPHKGRNLRSPDRRLTCACTIDLNSEWAMGGSYTHYDDELRRSSGNVTWTPKKGIEAKGEIYSMPGRINHVFSAKYDSEFFNIKVEESIINSYQDKEAGTKTSHSNAQNMYFGTNISKKGLGSFKNRGFNILKPNVYN